MLYHLVYKITNNLNGHYYIGVHSTQNVEDGYMGSGTIMRSALKKYGIQNFTREILDSVNSRSDAFKKEAELVTDCIIKDAKCYNLIPGGSGIKSKPIYSAKAETVIVNHKVKIPFDKKFEYKVDLLNPVFISNPSILTSFGKAFWDIITGDTVLDIITTLYNEATGNKLATEYISVLERLPAFRNNLVIYRYEKSTLDINRR